MKHTLFIDEQIGEAKGVLVFNTKQYSADVENNHKEIYDFIKKHVSSYTFGGLTELFNNE